MGVIDAEVDAIGLYRSADVLYQLFAKRHEPHSHVGSDMVVNLLRQDDSTRLRNVFEPGRHIDAVTVNVVVVDHHVTEMEADTELEPVLVASRTIAGGQLALDVHGTLKRVYNTGKFRERAIAHQLDDTSGVAGDCRVYDA